MASYKKCISADIIFQQAKSKDDLLRARNPKEK